MRVVDATGWLIVPGARVAWAWHPNVMPYQGEVARVYTTDRYPNGVVEFVDYDTRFVRTVRAEAVTVRKGNTQKARLYREERDAGVTG